MGIACLISGVGELWSACGLMNTFFDLCDAFGISCVFFDSVEFKPIQIIDKQKILSNQKIVVTPEPLIPSLN
jgi:hypothetical protein